MYKSCSNCELYEKTGCSGSHGMSCHPNHGNDWDYWKPKKSCDTCRSVNCNVKNTGVKHDCWDTSKDVCGRWKEKDDILEKLCREIYETKYNPEITTTVYDWDKAGDKYQIYWRALLTDIKQRIDKSLENIYNKSVYIFGLNTDMHKKMNEIIKDEFKEWI